MGRRMSDRELSTRKNVQAQAWRVGGALGLAGTGAFLASKAPGSARVVRAVPKAKKINAKKWEGRTIGIGATGGGLAGASSFNSASISAAEAKRSKKPIAKRYVSPFGITH